MPRDTRTGSRIRERRILAGLKQAELARRVEISASYLNLIEHNRRRIGGALLHRIAEVLNVEQVLLTEGAEETLVAALREIASDQDDTDPELAQAEAFAGRFPAWAALLARSGRRIAALERTVETLTDRMTHDPHLAASLHEMLTTVTAIRSAASILAEPGEIEPEWQMRFHRNIYDDSGRLAESSRALVSYLDAADDGSAEISVPQEEVDAVLEAAGHHFDTLETGAESPEALSERLAPGATTAARNLLHRGLQRYADDVARLPGKALRAALADTGADPLRLAQAVGVDPALAMRRLASLPPQALPVPVGLVICDASGTLVYRKPLEEFGMPRFGAACPLWPLYQALNRPGMVLFHRVAQPGRTERAFRAWAVAQPMGPVPVNRDPLYQSHMLIVPDSASDPADTPSDPVGVTCRICVRAQCLGRREPSILAGVGAEEF